jgi:hypothetical protein
MWLDADCGLALALFFEVDKGGAMLAFWLEHFLF